jgi:hypothetical protein
LKSNALECLHAVDVGARALRIARLPHERNDVIRNMEERGNGLAADAFIRKQSLEDGS